MPLIAMVEASNYTPEYLAESRVALVNAFFSIPIPIEILSTAFRIWVKARPSSQRRLAFDDYFIIWATITAVSECIAGLVCGAAGGLGHHIEAISEEKVETFLLGDYIFSHFYDFAIASTKLSVLALYYRIFAATKFRVIVTITAVCVMIWLVLMEIILGLGCQPVQGWWNSAAAATATCVDKLAFTYSTNIINLIFDIWIFTMPIPIILRLQASKEKKIGLCFLFSIGLGTCAISAARLSVVVSVRSKDITWSEVTLGILSAWEPCGSILCANLPLVYKPLVHGIQKVRSSIKSSRSRSRDIGARLPPSYHDWTRLDSSPFSNYPTSNVTAIGGHSTELGLIGRTGITVERDFKQEIHRELLG
ncbi:uncharacterized protein F4812DRAFT_72321 [Daldinia caldariorum]|uniref:uncharacterized protein n=1 Tax=Daldinia caldariorum TaxID=326644 RepID=UPI002007D296|nr:uncharacterized protein F4812DRAFT_72321 [Daldinia caldariorum]KAI1466976.1 hypothetical protein F4812DRAFT_72321 [Daldinia caldariorum]